MNNNTKDKPRIREIDGITHDSPTVITLRLFDPPSAEATPGQFAMIWVPESGEVPIAISGSNGDFAEFTIKKRGETTGKIHSLQPGAEIGIRGPYGVGFSRPEGPSAIIAGGYGASPLRLFYQKYANRTDLTVMFGASTEAELLFLDEMGPEFIATEDGTQGYSGYISDYLKEIVADHDFRKIYTAGPELMIKEIFSTCTSEGIELEASLERIMKCGFGLCGSCLIDDFRVCKDGPVVNLNKLEELSEFGRWDREPSGRKKEISG